MIESPESDPAFEGIGPFRRRQAWWQRSLDPEERRRVMADLAVTRVEHWAWRFITMLSLSVVVAVMGLALDSAAVVIGAMLLAPLMQPVLATGATLSMALFRKSLLSFAKVVMATAWCIAIAFGLSRVLPDDPLTGEVLARTQPDIKDLVVALAAGAAGAYATVREDVSSSLPGVAVAVALVPPLASVGITLEAGALRLAEGALLLYITNLAAILFASIVVFVATGFVPPRRLSQNLLRLTSAGLVAVALVIVVAVPLYRASLDAIERNTDQRTAEEIVTRWLGELDGSLQRTVTVNPDTRQVLVEVRGVEEPPSQESLAELMQPSFPGYDVPVQWVRSRQVTTTTLPPPEPTAELLKQIRVEVEAWLDGAGIEYQIDDIRLDGNLVRIDAAGIGDPPPIDGLVPRLAALDPSLVPGLNWATLATFTETTAPTPLELTREELRAEVDAWAEFRELVVETFDYDGERVSIVATGAREPDIERLTLTLQRIAQNVDLPVEVYFTERHRVTTTVPREVTLLTR